MLVGITGPSGAGKGCVTKVFERLGFTVIDADLIARQVVMPGEKALSALADAFGSDIIMSDGCLNRRLLGERAFSSEQNTVILNSIMHGEIKRRMILSAEQCASDGRNCLFDAPLLIEAELDGLCDVCVAVVASREIRMNRLMLRDHLTEQEIGSRFSRQHGDEYYTSHCEYVIVNDGDLAALERASAEVAGKILKQFAAE